MRDHGDGDALVVERLEGGHDFDARAAVEVARRLVGQEQRGIVDERAGDGHALLLAARELVGMMVRAIRQAHEFERPQRPGVEFFRRQTRAPVEHWQLHIFQRRGPREEVEALEDEPDFLIAEVGQRVAVERGNIHAVEPVASAGRAVEAAEDVHHGGFAGAARAHDREKFAGLHLE